MLQTRLAALGKGPPVLVLDTRPSGALVYVDGEVVGTTPIERSLLAGGRKIRVTLAEVRSAGSARCTYVPGAAPSRRRTHASVTRILRPPASSDRSIGVVPTTSPST
nr:PEGA domain-containing protein [Nannocystis sp. SCPEA4]